MMAESGIGSMKISTSRRRLMATSLAVGAVVAHAPRSTMGGEMESDQSFEQIVEQFYAAYNDAINGDPDPMLQLWSQEPYVSAMHSVSDEEVGWEQVSAAWRAISENLSSGTIAFELLVSHINGDVGFVAGIEQGSVVVNGQAISFRLRSTNIFERQDGVWKAIHHHGDVSPEIRAALT
jgi:ketosteroid isomerase-like protein